MPAHNAPYQPVKLDARHSCECAANNREWKPIGAGQCSTHCMMLVITYEAGCDSNHCAPITTEDTEAAK